MKKLLSLLAIVFCLDGWAQCSININGNPNICSGSSGTFTLSGASTYTWAPTTGLSTTNGAIVTITPNNPITYTITGTTGTCVATNTLAITVNPLPSVSINSVAPHCVPLCTSFTVNGSSTIASYYWDFGNGHASYLASPVECFTNAGISIVTLSVTSSNGCVNTAATSVITNPSPIIDFVANTTNGCPMLAVNFADLSNISIGTISSWNWNFGNGNLSSALNPPAQIYSNTSNNNSAFYTVSLTETSDSGCVATKTKNNYIEVLAKPFVSYTLTQNAAPFTWDVYPTYSDSVVNAVWNWGDGTNTAGLYPSHTYSTTGRYNICVIVANAGGCSDSTCQNDTIYRLAQNNSSNMLYVNVLQGTSGISQISGLNTQISIYPNPSNGIYTIQTTLFDNTSVEVYNLLGEKLFTDKLQSNATQINLSGLANGMYQLKLIKNNAAVYQTKISKVD